MEYKFQKLTNSEKKKFDQIFVKSFYFFGLARIECVIPDLLHAELRIGEGFIKQLIDIQILGKLTGDSDEKMKELSCMFGRIVRPHSPEPGSIRITLKQNQVKTIHWSNNELRKC